MNNYYVYLHIKETNGEPFYVGKGKDKRANISSGRNNWWNKIYQKYGFDIIFLEENLTNEEALILEEYWIKRIGRRNTNTGLLINLTDGGENGKNRIVSDETKRKMSISMSKPKSAQGKANIAEAGKKRIGMRFSKEVNLKKGKKLSQNNKAVKIEYNGKTYGCKKELWFEHFQNKYSYSHFITLIKNNKIK